ncbi:GLEYA domain-containing protein [Hypoxylon sp. FL0890]|nr:GLEYA domain-containing protein [Hypoxylon sp. FL0890]
MQIISALFKLQFLAAGALVVASPTNQAANTSPGCVVVQWVVTILQAYNLATPYCASVLNIPTVTNTAFTTLTVPTSTVTSTRFARTVFAPTTTLASTTIETPSTCTFAPAQKRDAPAELEERSPAAAVNKPAALANVANSDITTACRCLSIPTQTTTSTSTITISSGQTTTFVNARGATTVTPTFSTTVTTILAPTSCPVPQSCDNQGVQWAEYDNDQGWKNDPTYSTFNPEVYKTETPGFQSVITSLGGVSNADISFYGSDLWTNTDFYVIDHRGYLFAPQTGAYTISATGVDDAVFVWYGETAVSGWSRANDALLVTTDSPNQSGSIPVTLNAGDYLPFRIMYAQAQGGAEFQLSITAPDGTVISNTAGTPYLLQFPCGGQPYPAWGSES